MNAITLDDLIFAAQSLGCDLAAVQAVNEVETGQFGAFRPDGKPTVLFERHIFHRLTGGRFDASNPDISNRTSGGYGKISAQWPKLDRAIALDRAAALQSASWGAFQVMGFNWSLCGFGGLEEFVVAMAIGAGQMKAFVGYVKGCHLDDDLRQHDWHTFAVGYNGPAQNGYDKRLAAAYEKYRVNHVGNV